MKFDLLESGKSVEGRDIDAYRSSITGNKYIYLLGGTHGDEPEGIFVVRTLFHWLRAQKNLSPIPIVYLPILNPDGVAKDTRTNARKVDLNRNYPTDDWTPEASEEKYNPGPAALSEPENVFLMDLFENYRPGIILSFHSWKPVINFNGDCADIAHFISEHNEYPVSGYIGYPTPGSMGTFGPSKLSCPVITFECPPLKERESFESIWQENASALQELFLQNKLLRFL